MSIEGAKTVREPKYRELEYAIDGLYSILRRYHSLIEDMENGPSPKVEGTPPAPPSIVTFQHVYDGAEGRILDAKSQFETILSDIRGRLF